MRFQRGQTCEDASAHRSRAEYFGMLLAGRSFPAIMGGWSCAGSG